MPVRRRWLLAAAALGGAALAVGWASYPLIWPALPALPPPPEGRPRRRRAAADETAGCSSRLLLFGLPAAGRTTLLVRALLSHPDTVRVPKEVTDQPPAAAAVVAGDGGDAVQPCCDPYERVTSPELQRQLARGRFVDVRRCGGYTFYTPLDDGDVDGAAAAAAGTGRPVTLCLLKAPLSALPRLCATAQPPLLVYVKVARRERLLARLMLRDWVSRRRAEARLRAAEAQLAAALRGAEPAQVFDAVIDNDDLDWASDAFDGLIDAQLGGGGEEQQMHSAKSQGPAGQRSATAGGGGTDGGQQRRDGTTDGYASR